MTMSTTAHSPWSPCQDALRALLGSSRAWFGSASCCPGLAEGKAALVRSASLEARPLALSTHLTLAPPQNVRSWKLPCCKFFSSQLNLSTDLISYSSHAQKKKNMDVNENMNMSVKMTVTMKMDVNTSTSYCVNSDHDFFDTHNLLFL